MISRAELIAATGMAESVADSWLPHFEETWEKYRIDTPYRIAMWLAQCGHESMNFSVLTENLNYSANALLRTWPSRFHTILEANEYERRPEKIANRAYGGRMGNGPEASGDGWRFRGRGLIQLTGRTNYRTCGEALGVDLIHTPELLATKQFAALSAGWFWDSRELNALSDAGDVVGVTRKINGGTIGLGDRRARYVRALATLTRTNDGPPDAHPG